MADTLSDSGLADFRAAAERPVADGLVPGLVALVAAGSSVHVEAVGLRSFDGPPMTRDTIFRIASMTKPVTAAAVMALVDDGLIGLDEPIDRLLPEMRDQRVMRDPAGPLTDTVPARRPVTTRDLLTFTFGFGIAVDMFFAAAPWPVVVAADEMRLGAFGPPDPENQPDPDAWIAAFGSLPLIAQPGERWLYNTGAAVLGVLVARAAGQSFGEVLRSRVLGPLGMSDTAFCAADPGRMATAYRAGESGLEVWDAPDGLYSRPPAFEDGAGGLVSTADDMLSFARMFLRNGDPVLPADSVRAMTTDQLSAAQKARGGLGPDFFAGQSWGFCQAVQDNGAFGWDGGFGTTWLVDPVRDLVVIVLTQRMFERAGTPEVHRVIQEAAYRAIA